MASFKVPDLWVNISGTPGAKAVKPRRPLRVKRLAKISLMIRNMLEGFYKQRRTQTTTNTASYEIL